MRNFEKRVFCLYFGRFPIVKRPFLQRRVAKAEMTHVMAYGVFLLPVGLIRKVVDLKKKRSTAPP